MRYTEYHAGKAVIKDRQLLPGGGAMEKLAKLENLKKYNIKAQCCGLYCKYPEKYCDDPDELAATCDWCAMAPLFELLTE